MKLIGLIVSALAATASATCVDYPLRFRINGDSSQGSRNKSCEWVARKDTANRCALDGVSAACPVTCGACDSCVDTTVLLRFEYNGRFVRRSCDFVGRVPKKLNERCEASGYTCRSTCGMC